MSLAKVYVFGMIKANVETRYLVRRSDGIYMLSTDGERVYSVHQTFSKLFELSKCSTGYVQMRPVIKVVE